MTTSGHKKQSIVCNCYGITEHTSVNCNTSQDIVKAFREKKENKGKKIEVSQLIHVTDKWDDINDTPDKGSHWEFLKNITMNTGPSEYTIYNNYGYIKTHTYIVFSHDIDEIPKTSWLLDNQSTCEIMSNTKLLKKIHKFDRCMTL